MSIQDNFLTSSFSGYVRASGRGRFFHPYSLEPSDAAARDLFSRFSSEQRPIVYPDGSRYIGEIVNGKKQGRGILTFPSGMYYTGEWVQDQRHGQGKEVSFNPDGSIAETREGRWVSDEMEGWGRLNYEDGNSYEGEWVRGKPQGKGKYTTLDGSFYVGDWENGIALSNASHLGEHLFFTLLCNPADSFECEPPEGYCLGIMADYLQRRGYEEIGSALSEARRIFLLDGSLSKEEAERICKEQKPRLFASGTFDHAVGVSLASDKDPKFILCEIFNTGDGLDLHRGHQDDPRKFQTMRQVRIPASSVTADLIESLAYRFGSIEDLYAKVDGLPGAERVVSDSIPWQTMQQGNDCSLRWILAFCKNRMPEAEYKKMLAQLKLDCRIANAGEFESLR